MILVVNCVSVLLIILGSSRVNSLAPSGVDLEDGDVVYEESLLSTAKFLERRGFEAENHWVITEDGYILNLVRARNPLCRGRIKNSTVLFVHGVHRTAKHFMQNAYGAGPSDHCEYNAGNLNHEELEEILAEDPARNSLPLVLLNFGHDVWLLNRRGTYESTERIDGKNAIMEHVPGGRQEAEAIAETLVKLIEKAGSQSIVVKGLVGLMQAAVILMLGKMGSRYDYSYWNYSLDEQVQWDFENTVDYIRSHTGAPKVSVVAQSTGGGIVLMALAHRPDLARKLGQVILWSPALNSGPQIADFMRNSMGQMTLSSFHGPNPPIFSFDIIRKALGQICHDNKSSKCWKFFEAYEGKLGKYRKPSSSFLYNAFVPTSTNEMMHIIQSSNTGGIQSYYDYGNVTKNLEKYGSVAPPQYNFSAITCRTISLYAAQTDDTVNKKDLKRTHDLLKVPASFRVVASDDGLFGHEGYMSNDNVYSLLYVENLRKIERQSNFL